MTTQQLFMEFWLPADWLPDVFAGLELAGLLYLVCILQTNAQAMPHVNLTAPHPSITAGWDWLAA
jgi:hypothetical protein